MYGVRTLQTIPTMLLRCVSFSVLRKEREENLLEISTEDDGFNLETTGGQFGNERVANCADGELVAHGPA